MAAKNIHTVDSHQRDPVDPHPLHDEGEEERRVESAPENWQAVFDQHGADGLRKMGFPTTIVDKLVELRHNEKQQALCDALPICKTCGARGVHFDDYACLSTILGNRTVRAVLGLPLDTKPSTSLVYVVTSEPGGPGPIFVGVFGTRAAAEAIAKTAAGGQDFDVEEHMIETSAEEIRDANSKQIVHVGWRYLQVTPIGTAAGQLVNQLNRYGLMGWEFVLLDGETALFKKPAELCKHLMRRRDAPATCTDCLQTIDDDVRVGR